MSFVVIGSGPAGVAAARALVDAGRQVTVLDAGDTIEPGKMELFDELASSEPAAWPPALARSARSSFPATGKRIPLKPAYGSLFPYALDDPDLPIRWEATQALPSLALGGLSNAWGASILGVRERDIADWPITLEQLAPHYRAVLRFMPVAAELDELATTLPLYTSSPARLRRTPQMEELLGHMRDHAEPLRAAGFSVGAARLAVSAASDDAERCRYCGLCLHGCPYGSIYNAAETLAALVRRRAVAYHGGVYVDRLADGDDSVLIQAHERGNPDARIELSAARVLVACGAVSSTRLMLTSMGRTVHTARLVDSQYFLMPMASIRTAPVRIATQGNTLAQIFLELDDQRVAPHGVHMQLYGYNDLMLSSLAARLPVSVEALERALAPLVGRLIVVQGYLHSHDSPGVSVHLGAGPMRLAGDTGGDAMRPVHRLMRHLARNARPLGLLPLPGLAQLGLPGRGNHLGGSLPMRAHPCELESDTSGRLPGWSRVHVVDAAVLPSVPATTVTLSVMANAHRIATAAAAAD